MAKYECHCTGSFDAILGKLDQGILNGSMSASFEAGSDYSAITSGGSQAMFFKMNTWGEESFFGLRKRDHAILGIKRPMML